MASGARHRLVRAGLNQKATSIILNLESEPRRAAKILNDDEEAQVKWREKFNTPIKSTDVKEFKEYLEKQTQTSVLALMKDEDRAKELATLMHEKIAGLASRIGEQENLVEMLTGDASKIRESWDETCAEEGELKPYPKDVLQILEVLAKANKEVRETVKFVKEDGTLQNYIKNATFTNNQGMSESEVLDLVEKMRQTLGVSEYEMLRAYSEARRKPVTVDVEAEVK